MEVRYTVTVEDFVALNLYLTRKSGVGRPGYLVVWLGLPLLCAVGAVLQHDNGPMAFALVVAAVLTLAVYPFFYRAALARHARAFVNKLGGRGIIGSRTLILSEESLVATSDTFRTEARWENMTGVDVVGDRTYIFIAGISALILPRQGCDSGEEYEAARDFALRKLADRVVT